MYACALGASLLACLLAVLLVVLLLTTLWLVVWSPLLPPEPHGRRRVFAKQRFLSGRHGGDSGQCG